VRLNLATLTEFRVWLDVTDYVRIVRRAYKERPLGMGLGKSRFSSPTDAFRLLYLAQETRTSIAEVIIRDRFQDRAKRELLREEFDDYSIAAMRNKDALELVDLRGMGASALGVPTDAVRGRNHRPGRRFSQRIYDETELDGIVYMSRITNAECIAVYDRAVEKLETDKVALDLPRLAPLEADLAALHVTVVW
jgi:RES domain